MSDMLWMWPIAVSDTVKKTLEVKKAGWVSETAFISKVGSVLRMHRELEETDKPGKQTNEQTRNNASPKPNKLKERNIPPNKPKVTEDEEKKPNTDNKWIINPKRNNNNKHAKSKLKQQQKKINKNNNSLLQIKQPNKQKQKNKT